MDERTKCASSRWRWHDRPVPSAPPAVELLQRPEDGRIFTIDAVVRLGDVDRNGLLRLDSTARFLQDVATDDASDAALDRRFGWLVRRTLIDTSVPGRLGEAVSVSTWCTGIGRAWAERRSRIVGDRGARIDAVSLWVQVDVETGRPARVAGDFLDAYGATAGGRAVSARLSLSAPPSNGERRDWRIRSTDIDPFGHVNNAATWAFVEEYGPFDDEVRRCGVAEMEYLLPVEISRADTVGVLLDPPDKVSGHRFDAWLMIDGSVAAAARWTPASTGDRSAQTH